MSQKFIIRKEDSLRRENCCAAIKSLDPAKDWSVEIKQYRRNRSLEQNAFLHAVPLKIICEHTGHSVEDMKEFLLGEWSGWMDYEFQGRPFSKPLKTSTAKLDVREFHQFLEFIEMYAAHRLGLSIPRPGEFTDG